MCNIKRCKDDQYENFSVKSSDWDTFLNKILKYAG